MAKRNILFSLFVTFNYLLFAQIPYATQQPKWYFPIYAQDATGKKDTIYIGDDLNAQNGNAGNPIYNDPMFGEKWIIPQDPNIFNLATYYYNSPSDSVMKVDINNYTISNYLSYWIILSNVTLPVKFKWNLNKLRSDSLPFPSQSPLPGAQINISMPVGNYWVEDPNVSCNISFPIVVSDTIKSQCYCYAKDSLTLLDPFGNPNPQTFYLIFEVIPWSGNTPTTVKESFLDDNISIFPNPFNDIIQIKTNAHTNEPTIHKIVVYNLIGEEIFKTNFSGTTELNTSNWGKGKYLLKVLDEKGVTLETKIIIKN